jgi:hypothetical protein
LLSLLIALGCATVCSGGDSRAQKAGIDKHTLRMYRGKLFALYAAENLLSGFGMGTAQPGHPREWAITLKRRFGM